MAISDPVPRTMSKAHPTRKDAVSPFVFPGPISLPKRFSDIKDRIVSDSQSSLASSWQRLLLQLREEIELVSSSKSDLVPTINFNDITNQDLAATFMENLRERGVAIIRNVVPRETAMGWGKGLAEYLGQPSEPIQASSRQNTQLHDIFWSPAQIEARAHPNLLTAQKFAMSLWWSEYPDANVSTKFPITYADRVWTQSCGPGSREIAAHVDGGSVERWENDGYGHAGPYRKIWSGSWEEYDPWESSPRTPVTSDLYRGANNCSIFRMFSGSLSVSTTTTPENGPSFQVLPMPKLATAYVLLRPFFSPVPSPSTEPSNPFSSTNCDWILDIPQGSTLHGALPGCTQEITPDMHPHLELDKTLITTPHLEPGDYLIWHPDLVHNIINNTPTKPPAVNHNKVKPTLLYLPACPLTQTNALYLSRQRKSFLLGYPGPDFDVACHSHSRRGPGSPVTGEKEHPRRAGVQDVNDAGGDDGLRAMGLLPWDEEDAASEAERKVLAMGNSILFPDLFRP